ncbi:hypothetical protein Sjap_015453 [Stephania japonica]|uniref:Uncharacterized protein n=1 Tax=Stephania japonica TaxID=461633 RepID=A0AAP0IKQ7_9MAGN
MSPNNHVQTSNQSLASTHPSKKTINFNLIHPPLAITSHHHAPIPHSHNLTIKT